MLRVIYKDKHSLCSELLKKDECFSCKVVLIDERNLYFHTLDKFKFKKSRVHAVLSTLIEPNIQERPELRHKADFLGSLIKSVKNGQEN